MYHYHLKLNLFLCFLLTASFGIAQLPSHPMSKEIESIFDEWSQPESSGAAVAIVQNGKIVYTNEFGSADLENQTPITSVTKFQLRALQNQFIAYAVLLLEAEGKLSLNDKIQKYLPEMPEFGKPITIRHLLTHTHGLPPFIPLQLLAGNKMQYNKTKEQALQLLYGLADNAYEAGDDNIFSDSGNLLAAEIVKNVSGIPFPDFVQSKIFEPLEMTNTICGTTEANIIKNRARIYSKKSDGFINESFNYYSLLDFTIYSSAEDMARWMLNFKSPKVGSPDLIKKMNIPAILNNGKVTNAVLGQYQGTYKGLKNIEQNGRYYGHTTYIVQFPDQDFGIVVLGNAFNFQAKEAANKVIDLFLEKELNVEKEADKNTTFTSKDFIKLIDSELEKFCGSYLNNKRSYSRKVYLKDGKLFYFRSEGNESELAPISKNTFVLTEFPDSYTIRFEKKSDKEFMIFAVGDESEYINEKYDPVTYNANQLSEFTGLFLCKTLNVMYNLTMQDGKLKVSNNRIADFVLTSYKTDKFSSNINYFSNVEFDRDRNGNIAGFSVKNLDVGSHYFEKIKKAGKK